MSLHSCLSAGLHYFFMSDNDSLSVTEGDNGGQNGQEDGSFEAIKRTSILEGEGSWFVFGLRITQVGRYFRKGSIKHIIVLHGNTSRYELM
jgi:hypothetical protein